MNKTAQPREEGDHPAWAQHPVAGGWWELVHTMLSTASPVELTQLVSILRALVEVEPSSRNVHVLARLANRAESMPTGM